MIMGGRLLSFGGFDLFSGVNSVNSLLVFGEATFHQLQKVHGVHCHGTRSASLPGMNLPINIKVACACGDDT